MSSSSQSPVVATCTWTADHVFNVSVAGGERITVASVPGEARPGPGPSPMETVLAAVASCSAVDVVDILRKKRRTLESLVIDVTPTRRDEVPRIYTHIHLTYRIVGADVDEPAARQAVALSQDKYCSVAAMLRPTVELTWEIELNGDRVSMD